MKSPYQHLSFRLKDTVEDKAIKAKMTSLKKQLHKSYNVILKEGVELLWQNIQLKK
jgi:hypothetical protein